MVEFTHSDLFGEDLEASNAEVVGDGSVVYHESDVPSMGNEKDRRSKTVLVNKDLVPSAGNLLVDTVTYEAGVKHDIHYHEGTDHFFYILEGEGFIEVEGEEFSIEAGSIVWIGEGDLHRMYTTDERMKMLEYFSDNESTAVHPDGEQYEWASDS